jgi:hypothetical protein
VSVAAKTFRDHLRAPDDPRIAGIEAMDAYSWAEHALANPRAMTLFGPWLERYRTQDFFGITTDGKRMPGLYALADERAPSAAIAAAVDRLTGIATEAERKAFSYPADAREWRGWMNPEVYLHRHGLRLDEVRPALRDAAMEVLRASMSPRGYEKARGLMRINHFLGELVNAPRVMNEYSYNFNLFGRPSASEPWGWNFHGHHLCLNCLVIGGQMAFTPVFMGAEPNCIDAGPHAGLAVLDDVESLGLELMRALPSALRRRARLYEKKRDPAMPPGRVVIGDELLLGGAFQDNRVIPYEGAAVAEFSPLERQRLVDLVAAYLSYLPAGPFEARMREFERHLAATHFCWIGGSADDSPFYYRIQSPVLMVEFDHHAGVFLANGEPEKFHIHTLVRTPNGNDYGMDFVRQHCERINSCASLR